MNILLKVGDQQIGEEDLLSLLTQYQMLQALAREILIDQAIASQECTQEEQEQERNKFYQQNKITAEELPAWLKEQRLTKEQWEKLVLRRLKLDKFKQATWGNKLEAYFLKRKTQLDRIVYSLIRTQDGGIAQELYFRIQEGEATFAELAKEYSKGTEAVTGGLIGPVEANVPHPKIAHLLRTSKPGQVLPPTPVENWWIIVRLENFVAAELDEQMEQKLLEEQWRVWLREQLQQKVSLFPEEATASIDDEAKTSKNTES
ncbi:MAG: peptidylprolyl isomerase [Gomphosphaeria aponina SAG 52.96 = DSM 107014]|uniref:peptidylprolyl isomerase n=1 Tax=Gomphosphaeria aponina SAG 52.96 = DSM 107014 TaxID=1521640 RepID=A0A941GS83_9CHRO|nr:peptidylprolyl isomerase [Gomphosphaeria aponina SAG 52.96 = DSM 107014]